MAGRTLNKEQGSILLSALLLVVLVAIVLLGIIKWQAWQAKREQGITLGNQIAKVINAIEMRASFDENFEDGAYGVNALQDSRCGGLSSKAYLPCGFKWDRALLGGTPYFVINHDQSDPAIVKAQFVAGPIGLHYNGRFVYMPYLAATALNTAKAKVINTTGKFLSASAVYSLDRKQSAVTANIVANQNNANIYLRVDGSNQMQGKLRFKSDVDAQKRSIENVAHISSSDLDVESNALQINTTGHPVLLGNQSGVKGQSNVTVNDLTIHSLNNQKLTSLLKRTPPLSGFSNTSDVLSFNIKTGANGGALIMVFGGRGSSPFIYAGHVVLSLKHNGVLLREAAGWVSKDPGDHGPRATWGTSAQPAFPYQISGLAPFTSYPGYSVSIEGGKGDLNYIAYSVIPY